MSLAEQDYQRRQPYPTAPPPSPHGSLFRFNRSCCSLHNMYCYAQDCRRCRHCRHCWVHCRCHGLMDSLPDTLGGLSALTHLSLETASLTRVPESLGDLSSLRELRFSYCHCLQVI